MQKRYKILLSAYACEPNRGSEPGVGWHWANEIAKRGHNVYVITRRNNKKEIENYFKINNQPLNLEFIYYDLPQWASFWKKGSKGVHLYYYLWQLNILSIIKKLNGKIHIDIIHHITFVTIHQPSFLFKIKDLPFIYGPTAGGDRIPPEIIKSFPIAAKLKEYMRLVQIKLLKIDPIRRLMFNRCSIIYANSIETKLSLPHNIQIKTKLSLAIGTETATQKSVKSFCTEDKLKLLYVGNLIPLKGIDLLIKTFEIIQSICSLTIIGKGNINNFIKNESGTNTITHREFVPQDILLELYTQYDIFIFPSLRDSGGMVVLEALANGLPVICLDLGGPGQIVNETCGRVIVTKGKTENEIVKSITNVIMELQQNPALLQKLSQGALNRANEFTWEKTVARVYEPIEEFMQKN